jgi:phage terminase large subunit GpA-like protein
MDRGAVLSNPHHYVRTELPDGTPTHVSALQRCYDHIADDGLPAFLTEHQNDPPEDDGASESGITPRLVQCQVSGFEQGVIPEGCTVLVQGVDVGKWWLHWVVVAFRPDGTGFIIDYGRQNVYGTKFKSEEGLDRAIRREVMRRVVEFRDMEYAKQFRESLTLIDSGYRTEAVYAACAEAGLGVMPIKGIGFSAGVTERGKFSDVMKRTRDKQPVCDGVYFSVMREPGLQPFKLVCADSDQWKAWEHDRWMTAQDKPGCKFLYGEKPESQEQMTADQREHGHFAHHICAEVEVEDVVKGGIVRKWKSKNKENHWLDASYYADVAAAIKGVRVLGTAATTKLPPAQRPSARDLAQRGKRS